VENKPFDCIIVGAGAAGLMCSVQLARKGALVALLDTKERIGAKILMSGGTRCNVTHRVINPSDYHTQSPALLRHMLHRYSPEDTIRFFHDLGVMTVCEESGKYFPQTHSAKTVLEAFMCELRRLKVFIHGGQRVSAIRKNQAGFSIFTQSQTYEAKHVVLATGGLSFPSTGSDGSGYALAETFGHSLVSTSPSLTPLLCQDQQFKSLSGLSLEVKLTLWVEDKKRTSYNGSFLFTHRGYSGPVILNMSRHWIRATGKKNVFVNWIPEQEDQALRDKFLKTARTHPKTSLGQWLRSFLPARLSGVLIEKLGMKEAEIVSQLSRENREELLRKIFRFPLPISGYVGYEKAEVTAGGINLKEINPKTLESKKQAGLFFAGEVFRTDRTCPGPGDSGQIAEMQAET